jgi:hypothetical protein
MAKEKKEEAPPKPKVRRDVKVYEFRVFNYTSAYGGDSEVLVTTTVKFKDVWTEHGRPISIAKQGAEEYVRNVGLYGITIEEPNDVFNFYPPGRISKIEYQRVRDEE